MDVVVGDDHHGDDVTHEDVVDGVSFLPSNAQRVLHLYDHRWILSQRLVSQHETCHESAYRHDYDEHTAFPSCCRPSSMEIRRHLLSSPVRHRTL